MTYGVAEASASSPQTSLPNIGPTLDSIFAQPGLSYDRLRTMCMAVGRERRFSSEHLDDFYHEALIRVGRSQPPGAVTSSTMIVEAFTHAAIDYHRRQTAKKRGNGISVSIDIVIEEAGSEPSFLASLSRWDDPSYAPELKEEVGRITLLLETLSDSEKNLAESVFTTDSFAEAAKAYMDSSPGTYVTPKSAAAMWRRVANKIREKSEKRAA